MKVHISGLDVAIRRVHDLSKQGRFAMSMAMNNTLKQVQGWTVEELLPGAFVLRSRGSPWFKPRTRFGFNIRPFATKDRLQATMGSQADWLKLQEHGGTKRIAGHRIAIPTRFWKPREEIMEKGKKPRAIVGKNKRGLPNKPFIYAGTKMPAGIYVRSGQARFPLKMLFMFVDSASIKAVLDFEEKAAEQAGSIFQPEFTKAFARALLTAN